MTRDSLADDWGLSIESPAAGTPQAGSVHDGDESTFDLFKARNEDEAIRIGEQDASTHVEGEQEVSAADYNPDEDRKNDDRRHAEKKHSGMTASAQKPSAQQPDVTIADDEDDDDMFSIGHKVVVEAKQDDGMPAFVPVSGD